MKCGMSHKYILKSNCSLKASLKYEIASPEDVYLGSSYTMINAIAKPLITEKVTKIIRFLDGHSIDRKLYMCGFCGFSVGESLIAN